MLKKVMAFGTAGLVLVFVVLLAVKWDTVTAPKREPPPKPKNIDHNAILVEVKDLARQAALQFAAARKIQDVDERNAGIRKAMDTLSTAQDKLNELSSRKEYEGDDFEQVFAPEQTKMTQEMKTYRDAIRMR